ncbi:MULTISPECIES: Smr/MutS family protein [Gordonia]|uniref:Smr/MutS family protein n=1 Tax=Gordonia TaxID=2053 RepID=UPI00257CE0CA|nr:MULTISPECIES: hypothetical protein [Gordonia]
MTDPIPDPPPGLWQQTEQLLRHERELWEAGIDAPAWYPGSRRSETRTYRVGDRVRVIDIDAAGVVAEVIGDQELVVVDLHGQSDRITSRPANLEHLD